MRWQSLCRKKPGEEGDYGGRDDEREEGETEDEEDQRSTSRQSHQGSTRSRSPNSSSTVGSQGHKVSVLTYHNEEVGVLVSTNQELRVLFHVAQVEKWMKTLNAMRQKCLFRYGGATQHLASVHSASFFQPASCQNTCTQANRQH